LESTNDCLKKSCYFSLALEQRSNAGLLLGGTTICSKQFFRLLLDAAQADGKARKGIQLGNILTVTP
jgi:hypothetical protein